MDCNVLAKLKVEIKNKEMVIRKNFFMLLVAPYKINDGFVSEALMCSIENLSKLKYSDLRK